NGERYRAHVFLDWQLHDWVAGVWSLRKPNKVLPGRENHRNPAEASEYDVYEHRHGPRRSPELYQLHRDRSVSFLGKDHVAGGGQRQLAAPAGNGNLRSVRDIPGLYGNDLQLQFGNEAC